MQGEHEGTDTALRYDFVTSCGVVSEVGQRCGGVHTHPSVPLAPSAATATDATAGVGGSRTSTAEIAISDDHPLLPPTTTSAAVAVTATGLSTATAAALWSDAERLHVYMSTAPLGRDAEQLHQRLGVQRLPVLLIREYVIRWLEEQLHRRLGVQRLRVEVSLRVRGER